MHLGQASSSMRLEWTEFCTCATKANTSSECSTLKENDKPTQIYILNALYIMLNIFSSVRKNKPHKEIRNTVCIYSWDC
jgi:hypothetical protein